MAVCLDACRKAKEKGITVSLDLKYRNKFWSRKKAKAIMSEIVPYVDLLIANEEDAKDVFGITAKGADLGNGSVSAESYVDVARQIVERFGCSKVAITLRGSISANDNNWAGMLYDGDIAYVSRNYLIHIVDRVGEATVLVLA